MRRRRGRTRQDKTAIHPTATPPRALAWLGISFYTIGRAAGAVCDGNARKRRGREDDKAKRRIGWPHFVELAPCSFLQEAAIWCNIKTIRDRYVGLMYINMKVDTEDFRLENEYRRLH